MKIRCEVCKVSFLVATEDEKTVFEDRKEIVGPCGHKATASADAIAYYKAVVEDSY